MSRLSLFLLTLLSCFLAQAEEREPLLGKAVTVRNLTVVPVLARQLPKRPGAGFLTLDQGQASGEVVVGETGNVPKLKITNQSSRPLFLMAGEMVTGGKQDRIVAVNVQVPANSSRMVDVFCVERGRWNRPGAFKSSGSLVHAKLRNVAQMSKEQGQVWKEVAYNNRALGTSNPTGAYRFAVSDGKVGALRKSYLDGLEGKLDDARVVGLVVSISGKLVGADIYGTPGLFKAFRQKLLASYAMEAIARLPEALPTDTADARRVRALCRLAQGQEHAALKEITSALRIAPRADLYALQGRLLLSLDRPAEAVVAYDAALRLASGDVEARRGRLAAQVRLGAHRGALEDLAKLRAAGVADADLLTLEGTLLERVGSPGDARVAYARALALAPKHRLARYNRARLLVSIDKRRAKAALEALAKQDPALLMGLDPARQMGWGNNRNPQLQRQELNPNRLRNLVQEQAQQGGQGQRAQRMEQNNDGQGQRAQRMEQNNDVQVEVSEKAALAYVAKVLEGKAKMRPRAPHLKLASPPALEGGLIALVGSRKLSHQAPTPAAVQQLLTSARNAKLAEKKGGNLKLENKRCVVFGTGQDRDQMLHMNVHVK